MKRDVRKFEQEQLKLAKKVVKKDDIEEIRLVGGVDQTFDGNKVISAAVIIDYATKKIIERKYVIVEAKIPYIPEFLSYRESPAAVEAFLKLEKKPDVLMVDAHGTSHPRGIGMASHLGLLLDIPTIGVAKNILCGKLDHGKLYVDGKVKARELITKEHAKPIYVSAGHRVCLKTSFEIAKNCVMLPHKLPEPLYQAHRYARRILRENLKENQ
ncbi:endonuclease V [Candidatus Woesearchaeota archaeon]|nr:endonuclease V [Candidatus Woesearchaeota archaeon]